MLDFGEWLIGSFLPFLAFTLCSPIDSAASNIVIILFLNGYANASQAHDSIFLTYHLIPRGSKKHINIARCFCWWRESNPGCQCSKPVRQPLLHCHSATLENLDQCLNRGPGLTCIMASLEIPDAALDEGLDGGRWLILDISKDSDYKQPENTK